VPAPVRGRAVAAIGRIVEANRESLGRLVTRELGKPYAEALGEVQEIIDTCDFFIGEGRRLYGQTVPSEMPDTQLFTFRVPVGSVAVVRRRGPPPLRRERRVGQRQPLVGDLGARPVHPLAGNELGLLRPPAEGAKWRSPNSPPTWITGSRADIRPLAAGTASR
jgi:hypothetical protein